MGSKTKIDWCDSSWNPVTGCLHGCEYCYAKRIAHRYAGSCIPDGTLHILEKPYRGSMEPILFKAEPYPFEFDPTFHKYRLQELSSWKTPRKIFVCSMADLFGEWVPDEWIKEIFDTCKRAYRHTYLFLTKKPGRYIELYDKGILSAADNFWYGTTMTRMGDLAFFSKYVHTFLSIEPIMEKFYAFGSERRTAPMEADWIIIGAETGNRKGKVIPEKEWIDNIVHECRKYGKPVFMKESLRVLMGDDFIQEYPWTK